MENELIWEKIDNVYLNWWELFILWESWKLFVVAISEEYEDCLLVWEMPKDRIKNQYTKYKLWLISEEDFEKMKKESQNKQK